MARQTWLGTAELGEALQGEARQTWQGAARPGRPRQGRARPGSV